MLSEGINTCPSCGKEFRVVKHNYHSNDIRHPVGCPYCDATVGYASGAYDYDTYPYSKTDETTPTCPSCGIPLCKRVNHYTNESFWGCPNYPRCDWTESIK